MEWFVNGVCSRGEGWAVGCVCCQEGPADAVDGQGEDGEDEGYEGPAGAEGWKNHALLI